MTQHKRYIEEVVERVFTRRWVCRVVESGFHNGAGCTSAEPHGEPWNCGYRHTSVMTDEQWRAFMDKIDNAPLRLVLAIMRVDETEITRLLGDMEQAELEGFRADVDELRRRLWQEVDDRQYAARVAARRAEVETEDKTRLAPHGGCNWEGCKICFPTGEPKTGEAPLTGDPYRMT